MKYLVHILLVLIFFTACTSSENYQRDTEENKSVYDDKEQSAKKEENVEQGRKEMKGLFLSSPLKGNTGFITKKEGINFLKKVTFPDTIDDSSLQDNDTIGKYYKIDNTRNYLICFNRYNEGMGLHRVLVEVNQKGKYINDEVFENGGRRSCWGKKPLSGFQKHGEFFEFVSCATGSGHTSRHLYVFKKLQPQNSIPSIIEYSWTALEYGTYLQSTRKYKDNTLTMKYQLDSLFFEHVENSNGTQEHSTKINEGTIVFEYKNDQWVTKDSVLFKALEKGAY